MICSKTRDELIQEIKDMREENDQSFAYQEEKFIKIASSI